MHKLYYANLSVFYLSFYYSLNPIHSPRNNANKNTYFRLMVTCLLYYYQGGGVFSYPHIPNT